MVESIKELSQICQKLRHKEVGNWMVRNILRDLALPITWLLLHTPVSANQVTFVSIIIAVLGAAVFAFASPVWFLIGALLIQFWYLLDHVDGQIARYRKTSCLSGRFFDYLMHHIVHGSIPFFLGVYCFNQSGQFVFVLWGFLSAVAIIVFNAIHDTKYKVFFEKMAVTDKLFKVRGMQPEIPGEVFKQLSIPRKFFSLMHKACEIHVMMNILTLCAVLNMWVLTFVDWRFFLFLVYGILIPCIAVIKITYLISQRKIDFEYESSIEELDPK